MRNDMYFPYLTAEIKPDTEPLEFADRANMHSLRTMIEKQLEEQKAHLIAQLEQLRLGEEEWCVEYKAREERLFAQLDQIQ
ncbi:hypothetical protein UA08_08009 [Talaromyces atroroseus]|uniref:DUF7924 domain-containing protein n=1 Tax=Talaromyces atroroseus TaxID=1441469 RepID=A0A225ATA5_TALAT|nr:hypothetical protein UA08_08009 [Talaromyces atroroseus]OKL56697.1 hypothetical protein UA08_08009 [Talaromyces atroroseus]